MAIVVGIASLVVSAVGVYIAYLAFIDPRPPGPAPTPASRAAYLIKIDARCRVAGDKMSDLGSAPRNNSATYVPWFQKNVDIMGSLLDDWQDIPYPEADGPAVSEIMEAFELMNTHDQNSLKYVKMAVQASSSDAQDSLLNRSEDEWQAARTAAVSLNGKVKTYGLKDCATLLDFD